MKKSFSKLNPTARELLVHVLGRAHERHSIALRTKPIRDEIHCTCSCGKEFAVAHTAEYSWALRNVWLPEGNTKRRRVAV